MHNSLLRGIACLCLGILVFSLQDPIIKAVSGRYPLTEVMAIRCLVAFPILMAIVHRENGLGALLSPHLALLVLRAAILFFSYTFYYLAIAALPLADAIALFFTAPLFIVAMAGPYLGERITGRTLATILLGMAGVLFMLRPSAGLFDWAALLSLASAAFYGFGQLMARKMGNSESASVMTFYQNGIYLAGAMVVAAVFQATGLNHATHPSLEFLVRPWTWPTLSDFALMAACGLIASAGMILLSQAYRLASANRVATFEYTGILWTPMWGFFFFAEIPRQTTIIGAALIVGAGLLALGSGRRRHSAIA
ncbi:MAG: DMT family transporter [Mesorhizobium sp.]